jgi:hypothetical protein
MRKVFIAVIITSVAAFAGISASVAAKKSNSMSTDQCGKAVKCPGGGMTGSKAL